MYLMIENIGCAPVEGYTLLGVSTTSGSSGTIGQFGTGNKYGISACLRNGLEPIVYTDKLRLHCQTEQSVVNDGLTSKSYHRVILNASGQYKGRTMNKRLRTSFTTDMGGRHWTIQMGLREFISNALDRAQRENDPTNVMIRVVEDNQVRAKSGYTRVFIPFTQEVENYYNQITKRFLRFSKTPKGVILSKADRSFSEPELGMIYLEGIFVAQMKSKTLFDYNFNSNQLEIDECRNSDEYSVRRAMARAIGESGSTNDLITLFQSFDQDKEYVEHTLDYYWLGRDNPKWDEAWRLAHGDAVACSIVFKEILQNKGYKVIVVPDNWLKAMANHKVKQHYLNYLSDLEQDGKDTVDTPEAVLNRCRELWNYLESFNMTNGKSEPEVVSFVNVMNGSSKTLGKWYPGESRIWISQEVHGQSKILDAVILEEMAHYITGSSDNSRDFQNYFIQLVVETIGVAQAA